MEENRLRPLQKEAILLKPHNGFAALHLGFDILLSFVALSLSANSVFVLWMIGQGLLFVCIWRWFSILHSCSHGAFFGVNKINTLSGHLASIFAMVPYTSWKESHLQHHRWTGVVHKDPSLPRLQEPLSQRSRKFLDFCWRFYFPVFSFIFLFVKKKKLGSANGESARLSEFFPYILQVLLMIWLKGEYIKIFALPFVFYLISSDIVVLSQHSMIPMKKRGSEKAVPASQQDKYTRSLAYPKWVSQFVLLYFDKHTLHHIVPYVPHYYLGKLQKWSDNEVPWLNWLKVIKKEPGHKVYFE